MKRTFVIGDIHGALRALQQLLVLLAPTQEDKLIFLGDYVDGWPESADVIALLMELGKTHDCIFIKGNHDVKCEAWLNGSSQNDDWTNRRGLATVQSYASFNAAEKLQHLAFFESMLYYHHDAANRLFLHAGFTANDGPAAEENRDLLTQDRSLWEMALTMDRRVAKHPALFPKKLSQFAEIYIGHTPTLNYNQSAPMQACNVWDVDTGAAYYGHLSAINIDTKEIFQSEAVPALYPGVKGREF